MHCKTAISLLNPSKRRFSHLQNEDSDALMRICERSKGNRSCEEFVSARMDTQEMKAIKLSTSYAVETHLFV